MTFFGVTARGAALGDLGSAGGGRPARRPAAAASQLGTSPPPSTSLLHQRGSIACKRAGETDKVPPREHVQQQQQQQQREWQQCRLAERPSGLGAASSEASSRGVLGSVQNPRTQGAALRTAGSYTPLLYPVGNAPSSGGSAMAIPVKKAQPSGPRDDEGPAVPAQQPAAQVMGRHAAAGSVGSREDGPAEAGRGEPEGGRQAGEEQQKPWRKKGKPAVGSSTSAKANRWPEEPWWVRRLAARLLHLLQGVDPYRSIPPAVAQQVLEVMPSPLTDEIRQQLWGTSASDSGDESSSFDGSGASGGELTFQGGSQLAVGTPPSARSMVATAALASPEAGGNKEPAPVVAVAAAAAANSSRTSGTPNGSTPNGAQLALDSEALGSGSSINSSATSAGAGAASTLSEPPARPEVMQEAPASATAAAAAQACFKHDTAAPAPILHGQASTTGPPGGEAGEASGEGEGQEAADEGDGQIGDVFAAELAAIMQHYRQQAVQLRPEGAETGPRDGNGPKPRVQGPIRPSSSSSLVTWPATAAKSGMRSISDSASREASREAAAAQHRQLYISDAYINNLFRALMSVGGMEPALALFYILDHSESPYPTRTRSAVGDLMHLATTRLDWKAVLSLLSHAKRVRLGPDTSLYFLAMDCCAKCGQAAHTQRLLEEMQAEGLEPGPTGYTLLLMSHEKAGDWEAALEVYAMMARLDMPRSTFTYRALISSLTRGGKLDTAFDALDWMKDDEVQGNAIVYQTLINACLEADQWDRALSLLPRMKEEKVWVTPDAVSRLTHFCSSRNQPQVAFKLFKEIRELRLLWAPPKRHYEPHRGPKGEGSHSSDGPEGSETEGATSEDADALVGAGGSLVSASFDADLEEGEGELGREEGSFLASEGEEGEEGTAGEGAAGEGAGGAAGEGNPAAAAEGQAAAAAAPLRRPFKRRRYYSASKTQAVYGEMIAACQRARMVEEMWTLYGWMKEDGFFPDGTTYSRLAATCSSPPRPEQALGLYKEMLNRGVHVDSFATLHLATALAAGPDAAHWWGDLLRMLHRMHMDNISYRDTHVQTMAIVHAGKDGRLADGVQVYNLMLQDGVRPNAPTFNALMMACLKCGEVDMAFRCYDTLVEMGTKPDVVTFSTLIACCEKLGDVRRAEELWNNMQEQGIPPDTISYNSLICCYEKVNQPHKALELFEKMAAERASGHEATLSELCDALAKLGKWDKLLAAVQFRDWLEAQGRPASSVTYTEIMDKASRGGSWRKALELFQGMEGELMFSGAQPNTITYAAAITACARMGDAERALCLKKDLTDRGLSLSAVTFNPLLVACEAAGQLDTALRLLEEMRERNISRDAYTYSTLISCCKATGDVARALSLYRQMLEEGINPNRVVCNSLLAVCSTAGDAEAALRIFRAMLGPLQLGADDITYHCTLETLGKAQLWAPALLVLRQAIDAGYRPGCLCMDLGSREAATLDLHYLSANGAAIVLRAWLLLLKRSAMAGRRVEAGTTFGIVTGWGRRSKDNVATLKPAVASMLAHDLGPPLPVTEPATNPGMLAVDDDVLYEWLLTKADLGVNAAEEEEIYSEFMTSPSLGAEARARAQVQSDGSDSE